MIQIEYILIISAIMMFAGVFGFLTRRSTLAILLSVELMLNATDLNFIPTVMRVTSLHSSLLPYRQPRVPLP